VGHRSKSVTHCHFCPPPGRSLASHEEVQKNEKTDTVDTVLIRSANMATSSLLQWSHETTSAIVVFKICRQLLGATGAPTLWIPSRDFRPQTHWFPVKLQVLVCCLGIYVRYFVHKRTIYCRVDCRNDQISVVGELEVTLTRGYSLPCS